MRVILLREATAYVWVVLTYLRCLQLSEMYFTLALLQEVSSVAILNYVTGIFIWLYVCVK